MRTPAVILILSLALPASPNAADEADEGLSINQSLVVPFSAFNDSNSLDNGYRMSASGGYVEYAQANPAGGNTILQAPVILPQGSTIRGVHPYLYDNTTQGNVTVTLKRRNFQIGGDATVLTSQGTTNLYANDAVVDWFQTSIPTPIIDNNLNAYFLVASFNHGAVYPPDSLRLYAVRIEYDDPNLHIFDDNFETGDAVNWSSIFP